uniref:Uncharacterized protein n=1 Tax=Pipistrellus kuhlii TaxID=59472 RepID=A0A7J7UGK9_PIPKU|nr:hypothetical protein mPipKuh1_009092 [Pipistrellus kuhlii]
MQFCLHRLLGDPPSARQRAPDPLRCRGQALEKKPVSSPAQLKGASFLSVPFAPSPSSRPRTLHLERGERGREILWRLIPLAPMGSPYPPPHPHACLSSALRSPWRPESHPSASSRCFAGDAERGVAQWEEPAVARPLPCWLRP